TYELRIRVTKPPEDKSRPRFYGQEQLLGMLTKEVIVPAGSQELDLGSFELPLKDPVLSASSNPISLQGTTLDGKPFDLNSLRGKPVVLTFWANWAPKSKARLESIGVSRQELQNVAFVTVNLDEDP